MPVYNLCRICLKEESNPRLMQPLFEEDNERCNEIVQRIEVCGGIVLKPHEEFPKMICALCLDTLNTSYKFRSMCQASEHALLDAMIKSEMKSEPQEFDTLDPENLQADSENEMFFDLHTEFIDAQEVNLEDLAENVTEGQEQEQDQEEEGMGEEDEEEEQLESDMEAVSECLEDFIDCSDSDYEQPKPKAKTRRRGAPLRMRGVSRRGRPRVHPDMGEIKTELQAGKSSRRGRKKIEGVAANIMCEICGNIYTKRSLLKVHMRRHLSEKPFPCEICGKTFACPAEVGRHMRVHTGEKPYVCKYCGRTFADRSTNIKHERIHTNERPFTCQTCGKSFTYSNVLKNHMLTHTGEKPFLCLPCNKTFSRKHQLDQHIATITHQQCVKNMAATSAKVTEIDMKPTVELIQVQQYAQHAVVDLLSTQ